MKRNKKYSGYTSGVIISNFKQSSDPMIVSLESNCKHDECEEFDTLRVSFQQSSRESIDWAGENRRDPSKLIINLEYDLKKF